MARAAPGRVPDLSADRRASGCDGTRDRPRARAACASHRRCPRGTRDTRGPRAPRAARDAPEGVVNALLPADVPPPSSVPGWRRSADARLALVREWGAWSADELADR